MDTNGINKNINKQKRKITLCDLCNIINVLNPIGIKNLKLNPLTLLKTKYKQYIETNGIDQKIDDRIKKLINL
jgi:cell division FtsZ-interacting protein ZapD